MTVVPSGFRFVAVRRDGQRRLIHPGVTWRRPFAERIIARVDVRERLLHATDILIITADDQCVAAQVSGRFEVADALRNADSVADTDEALSRLATYLLRSAAAELSGHEMITGPAALSQLLLQGMRREASGWGVSVHDVVVTVDPAPHLRPDH